MRFVVINGPNLNLLGTREPEVYGDATLAELEGQWRRRGTVLGVGIDTFQSNHEGEIIDQIHSAGPRHNGIIINAGALSHSSYAIHDALVAIRKPTIEVHISNIHDREPWRSVSVTAPAATRMMAGRGTSGYLDAIDFLAAHLRNPGETIAYGTDPQQVFDLRIPDSPPKAVVALIHGGFWRRMWERDIMEQLADWLSNEGWITANLEYRRGPDSFAASNDDITTAITHLERVLDERGIDAGAPIRIGHSAGGYLAIRSVALGGRAIALGSVLDLDATAASRPDDDPVATYLGSSADEDPGRWSEARLSGPGAGTVHVIHGTADESIPVDHARAFAEHDGVTLTVLDGVDHRSLTDPYHRSYAAIVAALGDA